MCDSSIMSDVEECDPGTFAELVRERLAASRASASGDEVAAEGPVGED